MLFYLIIIIGAYLFITLLFKLLTKKRYKTVVAILITIPIIFSLYNIYEYREKALNEIFKYDSNNIELIVFNEGMENEFEWRTDNVEHVEALSEFLSQYRVEKMKNGEWDPDISSEKKIKITIYSEDKPPIAHVSLYENRLRDIKHNPYRVVNGPIDIEWIENYIKNER